VHILQKLSLAALLVGALDPQAALAAQRSGFGAPTGPVAVVCKPPFVLLGGRCADNPCPTGEYYSPIFKQCVPIVAVHKCSPGKVLKNGVCVPA
jgi:hypothetical protein